MNSRPLVEEKTVDELRVIHQSQNDFVLIDCRTPEEFAESQIGLGERLIPKAVIEAYIANKAEQKDTGNTENSRFLDQLFENKNTMIIVSCRSGRRSADIVNLLNMQGFTDAYSLQGGILAWQASLPAQVNIQPQHLSQ